MARLRLLPTAVVFATMAAACHAQPPPPPPAASPISENELARLRAELGNEPIIAFERKVDPPGEVWPLHGPQPPIEPHLEIILRDGTRVECGRKYVTRDGEVVSFIGILNPKPGADSLIQSLWNSGELAPDDAWGYVRYECEVHLPMVQGLFLNKGDYRLAAVATRSPAAFDSLVSLYGLKELLRTRPEGAEINHWLGTADYPRQNLAKFYWRFFRKTALEGWTLTFIPWRNARWAGARPEDMDSEIYPTPVGQVVVEESELRVLKGGYR